jgi:O-antigen ligase
MFALPGIVALLVFVYLRPQEIWPRLAPFTLPVIVAACVFGLALDVRRRHSRPLSSPILVASTLFFAVCIANLLPHASLGRLPVYLTSFLVAAFLSQAIQGIRPLRAAAGATLVISLVLAAVGVHQGLTPRTCMLVEVDADSDRPTGLFTDRRCQHRQECSAEAAGVSGEYECERAGLLGTTSIGGRVRYRGLLQDPNELAWAVSAALPFVLAFLLGGAPKPGRWAAAAPLIALGIACVVMTQSRMGQIVAVVGLAAYFGRKFWLAAAVGAVAAAPLLLLGGRSGEEAEASATERIECWIQGLGMWREHPLLGVGTGQFTEHHALTAHNSVVLTLAELGPLGLYLWTAVIYLCFKTAILAERQCRQQLAAAALRPWAAALIGGWAATAVASFFLSLAYHAVLWVYVGLTAALYAAVRRHDPEWRVPFDWRDAAAVAGLDGALVTLVYIMTRVQG